jgi:uncharacterized membrane protein SpoIIM required for sporulation
MVLESLIKTKSARKHPLVMLVLGIVLASIGIILGLNTFPKSASVLSVAFVTIGSVPMLHALFRREEREEAAKPGPAATFLERHFDIIMVYAWLFVGLIISYALWYAFMPTALRESAFSEQEETWKSINSLRGNIVQSEAIAPSGASCSSSDLFSLAVECIFFNNAMVLGWAIVFSLVYGAGAVFLIAWNASVIGLVLGKEILARDIFSASAKAIGLLPHGSLEIVAYFIGAIAGGIISAVVTKSRYKSHELETIVKDALFLVIIAYGVLLAAAIVEAALILYY